MNTKSSKSSRHGKITGDFGEMIVLYYLSRYGFECARIDHTGIDLIAKGKNEDHPWGISVKAVSREEATDERAKIISRDDISSAEKACQFFNCRPYLAIVFDAVDTICILLKSIDDIKSERNDTKTYRFSFSDEQRRLYSQSDYRGRYIELSANLKSWNKAKPPIEKESDRVARMEILRQAVKKRIQAEPYDPRGRK